MTRKQPPIDQGSIIRVDIKSVKGSSPRNAGARMYVSEALQWGTIGGGSLEWYAIQYARTMIAGGLDQANEYVPLGPNIGQCCGGVVELDFREIKFSEMTPSKNAVKSLIYIFGSGHTGLAFGRLLAALPETFVPHLIDSRNEWIEKAKQIGNCQTHHLAMPETLMAEIPDDAAVIVMTHSHEMDFCITSSALIEKRFAYVGMIGSETKRKKFENWVSVQKLELDVGTLICPIGQKDASNKHPEEIALTTINQISERLNQMYKELLRGRYG